MQHRVLSPPRCLFLAKRRYSVPPSGIPSTGVAFPAGLLCRCSVCAVHDQSLLFFEHRRWPEGHLSVLGAWFLHSSLLSEELGFSFSLFVACLGQGLTIHLSSLQTLSSRHPLKQADRGGSTPYWLGAAQLEAGGSCPVGLRGSLPPSKTTRSVQLYANRARTYNS